MTVKFYYAGRQRWRKGGWWSEWWICSTGKTRVQLLRRKTDRDERLKQTWRSRRKYKIGKGKSGCWWLKTRDHLKWLQGTDGGNQSREMGDEHRKCLQRLTLREGKLMAVGATSLSACLAFSKYHMTAPMCWKLPQVNYLPKKLLRKNMFAISEMRSRTLPK